MVPYGNTFFFNWEVDLMVWLQTHLGPAMISFITFFSIFGEGIVLVLFMGLLYWCYDKKTARTIGLSVMTGATCCTMIKGLVLRRRPYFDHEQIKVFRPVKPDADLHDIGIQGYSFPSIHSSNAMILFVSMALLIPAGWLVIPAVVLPFMTGLSRVVAGVHYPTDVLTGWLIGLVCVIVIPRLEKKLANTAVLSGILVLVTCPGLFFCRGEDYFTSFGLLAGFAAGTLFEEKFVHFENTRKPLQIILRMAGGLAIYLVLNIAIKRVLALVITADTGYMALLGRSVRYALLSFIAFGLYPALFRFGQGKAGEKNPPETTA